MGSGWGYVELYDEFGFLEARLLIWKAMAITMQKSDFLSYYRDVNVQGRLLVI